MQDAFNTGVWGRHVRAWAGSVGLSLPPRLARHCVDVVDMETVQAALMRQYDSVFVGLHADPRQAPDRPRLATYFRWFDRGAWGSRPPYVYLPMRFSALARFVRFNLSCHDLVVEIGRWKHRRRREDRLCTLCSQACIDDERHLVFQCDAYADLRDSYRRLFVDDPDMPTFFAQNNQRLVIQYVLACLERHAQLHSS